MQDQEWSPEDHQHWLNILARTSHAEPLEAFYYWEKTNQAKHLTRNSISLSLWIKPACQTLSKALDVLRGATARVDRDTTVKRSAVGRDDLKPYWKSEKRAHFLRWLTSLLLFFIKFFKDFTNDRKKTSRTVVFNNRPLQTILKYRDHRWEIWKRRFFQIHIEEFS